jgi:hypothetical protein
MPFFAIPGTYDVKGLSPDGDSIRFKATDPDLWRWSDLWSRFQAASTASIGSDRRAGDALSSGRQNVASAERTCQRRD